MSFARFSDESQVYIYDDVAGYVICCFCPLVKRMPDRTEEELDAVVLAPGFDREMYRKQFEPDFRTTDLDAMLAHLAEHRAVRHVVPRWLDARLIDEWPYPALSSTAPNPSEVDR